MHTYRLMVITISARPVEDRALKKTPNGDMSDNCDSRTWGISHVRQSREIVTWERHPHAVSTMTTATFLPKSTAQFEWVLTTRDVTTWQLGACALCTTRKHATEYSQVHGYWGVLAARSVSAKRTHSTQLVDATPKFGMGPQTIENLFLKSEIWRISLVIFKALSIQIAHKPVRSW